MATKLPYMSSPGTVTKILKKIKEARTPDRFNADFLATKLGFKGGNAKTFISWAKKVGLINTDGTPTEIYKKFRNPSTEGWAMAEALKKGYAELYSRNEYCHELNRKELTGLVVEATGLDHDARPVELTVSTFMNAKEFADFEARPQESIEGADVDEVESLVRDNHRLPLDSTEKRFNLAYTINIVLPKTDDPAVYRAIFTSLSETLMKD